LAWFSKALLFQQHFYHSVSATTPLSRGRNLAKYRRQQGKGVFWLHIKEKVLRLSLLKCARGSAELDLSGKSDNHKWQLM
jgi:hypothetical protein